MAKLVISVGVAGVHAIAGPLFGAAVLFSNDTKMPRFQTEDRANNVTRIFSLLEPDKIPAALVPHVVDHIRKIALTHALVHRPACRVVSSTDTPWTVMGQAAARTAERAAHLHRSDVQVGTRELEIHVPPGGFLPYEFVGKIGQRPVKTDWRRNAATLLAQHTHRAYMLEVADRYPDYKFAEHFGNDTPTHRRALKTFGPTPEHRSMLP